LFILAMDHRASFGKTPFAVGSGRPSSMRPAGTGTP